MSNEKIYFVSSTLHKDEDYVKWLKQIKAQYLSSQAKAAVRVNDAMMEFYWNLGHDIVDLKAEARWGDGVIKQLSLDMKDEFPDVRGFSTRNLWYVKQWYKFYSENFAKLPQLVAEFIPKEKLLQAVAELTSKPDEIIPDEE